MKAEYLRRGGARFRQVVAIGDGAAPTWGMAGVLDPHATHITEMYHAREHLHDLAADLAFITWGRAGRLLKCSAELHAGESRPIIDADLVLTRWGRCSRSKKLLR